MCRLTIQKSQDSQQARHRSSKASDDSFIASRFFELILDVALFVYTIGFLHFRVGELIPLIATYPMQCLTSFLGALLLCQRMTRPIRRLVYVVSFFGLIQLIDVHIPKSLPAVANEQIRTILITGANSGIGYQTARTLAVTYGKNVILGCRSETKCFAAAQSINEESSASNSGGKATPMRMDLADFESVSSLVSQLSRNNQRIDILFNNAGYAPATNLPVNQYGLDPAFTSMHLSHYLLTELLLKGNNPELRVVTTSSQTHHLCAVPFAILPQSLWQLVPQNLACVNEQFLKKDLYSPTTDAAYIEAKVANMMHALEIPRRHRQTTAVAIDLGWVGTAIQPWMKISLSPTALGWMRSAERGVLPILHAMFASDEEIQSSLGSGGVVVNTLGYAEEAFTYPWWNDKAGTGRSRMLELSELLWNTSDSILKENGYLTQKVPDEGNI